MATNITTITHLLDELVPKDGATISDASGATYTLPVALPLARQVKVARLFEAVTGRPAVRTLLAALGGGQAAQERRMLEHALGIARGNGEPVDEETAQQIVRLEAALADLPAAPTLVEALLGLLSDDETLAMVVQAFEVAHPVITRTAVEAARERGEEATGAGDVFSGEVLLLEGVVPFFASAARALVRKAGMLEALAAGKTSPSGG